MIKTHILSVFVALGFGIGASTAIAAEGGHVEDYAFSFEGPFGSFDQAQLQRGLQVYTEVCAACHGLQYVPFRDLEMLGYSDAQVRAYAANYLVPDLGPEAAPGDERPAEPTDHFPKGTFSGAPDLSLMAKARAGFHGPAGLGINQFLKGMGGPEYITSLMVGYTGHEKVEAGTTLYENTTFASGYLSMPQPLLGDDVEYHDGTETSIEQEAKDVSAFLMWAAEPKMDARKQWGMTAVIYLAFLTVLMFLTNKKLWAPVKRKA